MNWELLLTVPVGQNATCTIIGGDFTLWNGSTMDPQDEKFLHHILNFSDPFGTVGFAITYESTGVQNPRHYM